MIVDEESVEELFTTHDLEGLIAEGAPADEYEPEMEQLIEALAQIPTGEASQSKIVAILTDIWRKDFSATEDHLEALRPGFEALADTLLEHYD
ncbi:hypothetical protein SAMN05421771_2562 [Granulicella pectinivorans]|uniref:Uncharacterized protein n=1 Tax=Granulicella pectinivorans TaxID=474950 RepID=A0A1I6MFT2_9BACT|nr:hypothetical protein [Granulicella pectinivorans]SFS14585.1 hypothetical protein SAMN05421771_2562 [Granulicella pectinivorans]